MKKLDRRTFLRGFGGVALSLPILEAMGCASGASAPTAKEDGTTGVTVTGLDGAPKRLVIYTTSYGTVRSNWQPQGTETSFTLSPILAPLTPFKSKLLVLDGIDNKSAIVSPVGLNAHHKSWENLMCGRGMAPPPYGPGGISFDQAIANVVGAKTKLKSLQVATATGRSPSAAGLRQPLPAEPDPAQVFARLFGDYADPVQRRSVLDGVKGDYDRLLTKVSGQDKLKLEQHLASIREVEVGLQSVAQPDAACVKPTAPKSLDGAALVAPENAQAIEKLHLDLVTLALACDLTRVVTKSWGQKAFPWLGFADEYHPLSHDETPAGIAKLTKIYTYFAQQIAYLLGKMSAIKEGSGTMLDNSVVLWMTEMSRGYVHDFVNVPFVIAGSGGGYFKTGRYVDYGHTEAFDQVGAGTRPHNDLLVSVSNAMGLPIKTFGDPAFCTGPLPRLT